MRRIRVVYFVLKYAPGKLLEEGVEVHWWRATARAKVLECVPSNGL